jgi:hypothetical protein
MLCQHDDLGVGRQKKEFRGVWRGAGSSGFFRLSRLFGSTNERDNTDPHTR